MALRGEPSRADACIRVHERDEDASGSSGA